MIPTRLAARYTLGLPALTLAMIVASPAVAQDATADSLFQQGTQLFARGEIKAACDRFAASYKLDAAPGTLFDMAVCHEKDGRLWKARGEFLEFIDRAIKVGKPDKAQPAVEHVTALEPRLPRLELVTGARRNVEAISVDGVLVATADWNKPIAVDPSRPEHDVELKGTGLETRVVKVTAAEGAIVKVDIPVLAGPEVARVSEPPHRDVVPAPPVDSHPTRTVGIIVGGAGIAALAAGGVFGALTFSEKSAAQTACPATDHVCTDPTKLSSAQGHHSNAETDSWVSTIGLGAGAIAVGLGAYLVFRHGSSEPPAGAVHLLPTIARDGGGLTLLGPF